jgi:HK97 gp10 family phage protein
MANFEIRVSSATLELDKKFLKKALRQAANQVQKAAIQLINSTAGAGRMYGSHRASAPGQAPATDTGNLAKNFKIKMKNMTATVSDDAWYALSLEAGSKGGGGRKRLGRNRRGVPTTTRIQEARPFLSTALDNNRVDIERKLSIAIQQGIDFKKVT